MSTLNLKSHTYPGKLIVFEGTDGAGKTTMLTMTHQLLAEKFGEAQLLVVKQPTDMSRKTKLFQKMMYCPNHDDIDYRAVQLLTMSDRVQHSFETIVPALKQGKIVICDRYVFTSLANMLARGYRSEAWFFDVSKHLLRPDVTFLAYVHPDTAIKRIKSRPEECDRHLNEVLLNNVAGEFLCMSEDEKFTIIDTSKPAEISFESVKAKLKKEGIL